MSILLKQNMSQRKIDGYLKLAEIIQWGRAHPVKFIELFFGIELLDYQKYVTTMSWTTPFSLWLMGRSSGKTTLAAPFIMAKTLLIPNFNVYIMAGVGSQSQEAFLKIENIAKKNIASFTGLTDVFFNETVKSAANTDGFTHNPAAFKCVVYNGSTIHSLNGAFTSNRSKRSGLNFYDESGFAPDELFVATLPFITQNSDFRLGGDIDVTMLPKQIPNQAIFASSASSMDTYFYRAYRDFSKRMFMGDKRYFVADINSDVVCSATYNGKIYPVALLTQETIDNAMRDNREKAMREYKNVFSADGGENQIIKRSVVIRNTERRLPVLYNDTGQRRFVLAYDPARSYDNSICMVGEIVLDKNVGYKLQICNGVSFVDIAKKKKTPMRTPEQAEFVKQMLLDYNGKNKADYENIETLLVDAGSGGGGVIISDYFMEDWTDASGVMHKGLIDKIESSDYTNKFPNAVDKFKLMSPQKYKKAMFEALIEMMHLDLITFTEEYDMKGYLNLFEDKEIEYEDDNKNKKKQIESQQKRYNLTFEEELALKNIDLAKEELVNIYRFESGNGNCRYDLPADKTKTMNDDRAYTLAMLAWYLQQLRRENITSKQHNNNIDLDKLFLFKQPSMRKY